MWFAEKGWRPGTGICNSEMRFKLVGVAIQARGPAPPRLGAPAASLPHLRAVVDFPRRPRCSSRRREMYARGLGANPGSEFWDAFEGAGLAKKNDKVLCMESKEEMTLDFGSGEFVSHCHRIGTLTNNWDATWGVTVQFEQQAWRSQPRAQWTSVGTKHFDGPEALHYLVPVDRVPDLVDTVLKLDPSSTDAKDLRDALQAANTACRALACAQVAEAWIMALSSNQFRYSMFELKNLWEHNKATYMMDRRPRITADTYVCPQDGKASSWLKIRDIPELHAYLDDGFVPASLPDVLRRLPELKAALRRPILLLAEDKLKRLVISWSRRVEYAGQAAELHRQAKRELEGQLEEIRALGGATGPKPPPTVAEQHTFLDHAKRFEFDIVRRLVSSNHHYVNAQPSGRWTALHQACQNLDPETVRFLLERGADVTLTTRDGETPKDVAQSQAKPGFENMAQRAQVEAIIKTLENFGKSGDGTYNPAAAEAGGTDVTVRAETMIKKLARLLAAKELEMATSEFTDSTYAFYQEAAREILGLDKGSYRHRQLSSGDGFGVGFEGQIRRAKALEKLQSVVAETKEAGDDAEEMSAANPNPYGRPGGYPPGSFTPVQYSGGSWQVVPAGAGPTAYAASPMMTYAAAEQLLADGAAGKPPKAALEMACTDIQKQLTREPQPGPFASTFHSSSGALKSHLSKLRWLIAIATELGVAHACPVTPLTWALATANSQQEKLDLPRLRALYRDPAETRVVATSYVCPMDGVSSSWVMIKDVAALTAYLEFDAAGLEYEGSGLQSNGDKEIGEIQAKMEEAEKAEAMTEMLQAALEEAIGAGIVDAIASWLDLARESGEMGKVPRHSEMYKRAYSKLISIIKEPLEEQMRATKYDKEALQAAIDAASQPVVEKMQEDVVGVSEGHRYAFDTLVKDAKALRSSVEAAKVVLEEVVAEAARRAERAELGVADPVWPSEFYCPISHEVMRDPVTATDGFTYERVEIQKWIGERPADSDDDNGSDDNDDNYSRSRSNSSRSNTSDEEEVVAVTDDERDAEAEAEYEGSDKEDESALEDRNLARRMEREERASMAASKNEVRAERRARREERRERRMRAREAREERLERRESRREQRSEGIKSPKTGEMLKGTSLVPNTSLKILIRDFGQREHDRLVGEARRKRDGESSSGDAPSAPTLKRQKTSTQIENSQNEVKEELRKLGLTAYTEALLENGYDSWAQVLAMSTAELDEVIETVAMKKGHASRLKNHILMSKSQSAFSGGK